MRDHSQVVQDRAEEHYDLRIIVCHPMVSNNVRLHSRLEQVSEYLEGNVRDYCEVNGPVIRQTQSPYRVDVDAFP